MSTDDAPDGEAATDDEAATDSDGPSAETLAEEAQRGRDAKPAALSALPPLDAPLRNRPLEARITEGSYLARLFSLIMAVTDDVHHQSGVALRRGLDATVGFPLSAGTIYPVLDDLEQAGLIEPVDLSTYTANTVGNDAAVDAELAAHERELEWYLAAVQTARDELASDNEADDPGADAADTTDP